MTGSPLAAALDRARAAADAWKTDRAEARTRLEADALSAFEERAAILEYDHGLPRDEAEAAEVPFAMPAAHRAN